MMTDECVGPARQGREREEPALDIELLEAKDSGD